MKAIAPLALAAAVMAGAFAAAMAFGTVAAEVASFVKSVNVSAAASVNSDHRSKMSALPTKADIQPGTKNVR